MKSIPWILVSLTVAFTSFAQKKPSYTPDQAVARMKLPEGFSVTQFAAEPDVVQPFAFCFDDRGRVWVCENLNYETRKSDTFKQGPKGRILILEDTNGDGRFDKRKVFIEKIFFPTGLQVGFGGVWVGSPPNLLFIPDKNGDDVPDGDPIVVLDGVTDPRNLGAIMRNAAWFDVPALVVPKRHTAELTSASVTASAGAACIVPVVQVPNLARALDTLKAEDIWIYSADRESSSVKFNTAPLNRPAALIMGDEGRGIRPNVADRADVHIQIPGEDVENLDSLNVSVAAGVLLSAFYNLPYPE